MVCTSAVWHCQTFSVGLYRPPAAVKALNSRCDYPLWNCPFCRDPRSTAPLSVAVARQSGRAGLCRFFTSTPPSPARLKSIGSIQLTNWRQSRHAGGRTKNWLAVQPSAPRCTRSGRPVVTQPREARSAAGWMG